MLKYILLILIVSTTMAQDTLNVIRLSEKTSVTKLEVEIVKDVINLYNLDNKVTLDVKYHEVQSTSMLFDMLERLPNAIIVNSISNQKAINKGFEYSKEYLSLKEHLYSLKNNKISDNWEDKLVKIAYVIDSPEERLLQRLFKMHRIVAVATQNMIEKLKMLRDGNADFIISDETIEWNNSDLKAIKTLDSSIGYGYSFVYSNNFALQDKFNACLNSYLSSEEYLNKYTNIQDYTSL